MVHSPKIRKRFETLRAAGRSLGEISKTLGISKSTASLWGQKITVSKQGQQRLRQQQDKGRARGIRTSASARNRRYREEQKKAHDRGFASEVSVFDGVCLGLYWGEGAKSEKRWRFSNTDRRAVSMLVEWAKRAGHTEGFVAGVNAYDDSEYDEKEIQDFWKKAGIERVTVSWLPSKGDPRKHGRYPFGCCHVRSIGNGSQLYAYYEGQLAKVHQSKSANEQSGRP